MLPQINDKVLIHNPEGINKYTERVRGKVGTVIRTNHFYPFPIIIKFQEEVNILISTPSTRFPREFFHIVQYCWIFKPKEFKVIYRARS